MDILNLVDKLEELFSQGRSVPLTHNVIIDEDQMLDIIDQMRISIPDEIKRSQQVLAQRDRILAQAKEEHDRTIEIAREKRDQLVGSHEIAMEAKRRSEQIISQAYTEADVIKREADKYTLDSLQRLEKETAQILKTVQNGIRMLERDQQNTGEEPKQ